MTLEFKVDGQALSRRDLETVAANARNFLACRFEISEEWFAVTPYIVLKAVFERGEEAYGVILDDERSCLIPHEVLKESGHFFVSLIGLCADEEGTPIRATSNRVAVPVDRAGASDTQNSAAPTPTELEQLENKLAELGHRLICLSSYTAAQQLCYAEGQTYHFIWIAPNAEFGGPGGLILRTGGVYAISKNDGVYTVKLTADLNGADGRDGRDGADGADGERGERGEQGEKGERGEPGEPLKTLGADELEAWCSGLSDPACCLATEDIEYAFTLGTERLEGRMSAGDVYRFTPDPAALDFCFSLRGDGDAQTVTVMSDNLFDKTAVLGAGVFSYDSQFYELVEGGDSRYAFVPLRGAGIYRTKFNWSEHEWSGGRIALTDKNHIFVTNAEGSVTPTDDPSAYDFEFTVTEAMIEAGAACIAYDCWKLNLDSVMIVKDRDYPDSYLPYGYVERATANAKKVNNPLTEKKAVFLGDSISAGTTVADPAYYGYGWAGLIGEANLMQWHNLSKDGGTVTALDEVAPALWLANQLEAAKSLCPDADYVIFEGGCNDADRMGDGLIGELVAGYDGFDESTFSGAFEAFVKRLIGAYPYARLGYIIPQKMYPAADHSAAGHIHRRYFDRAAEICRKWGIAVLDLWNSTPLNPSLGVYYDPDIPKEQAEAAGKFYTDSQHLTLVGYRYLAERIEAWMRDLYGGGSAPASAAAEGIGEETVTVTIDSSGFSSDKDYAELSSGLLAGKKYGCCFKLADPDEGVIQEAYFPLSFFSGIEGDEAIVFSGIIVLYGSPVIGYAQISGDGSVTAGVVGG